MFRTIDTLFAVLFALFAVLLIACGLLMTAGVIYAPHGWVDVALVFIGFNLGVMAWFIGNGKYNARIGSGY